MTVAITRLAMSAAELRSLAAQTQDAKAARRMLAIGLVLEGWSREAAAEVCAMDRQTLRDWVHRYNELGPEGLFALPRRNGPLPRLTAEQQAKVVEWVEQGPNLERDGVVRWRCVDLQRRIGQAFAVQLHERTVGKLLRKLSFRRVSVRPQHPQSKPEEQAVFSAALPPEAAGKPVEIWFTDEARVGQQGTLTRVWAKRGSRPRARRDRRFEWAYLFGAICPERGTGAAIIMPEVNVAAMNEHLGEISRRVSVGAIALLVLDGAGWHSSPRVKVPANIVLLPLPPYAPELNPMENVWEFMRGNFLSHCVWDGYDAILEACCDAWNKLMQMTERIASLTRRTWAKPVAG